MFAKKYLLVPRVCCASLVYTDTDVNQPTNQWHIGQSIYLSTHASLCRCQMKMKRHSKRHWKASGALNMKYDCAVKTTHTVFGTSTQHLFTSQPWHWYWTDCFALTMAQHGEQIVLLFLQQTSATQEAARIYLNRSKYVLHEAIERYEMDQKREERLRQAASTTHSGLDDDDDDGLSLSDSDPTPVVSNSLTNSWDMAPAPPKYVTQH
jgi:hypothetical protein